MKFSEWNGPMSSIFLQIQSTSLECPTLHEWQEQLPPRAVPSILVKTIPVTGVIFENSLACTKAF